MSEKIGNVWVFIEQEAGKIASVSLELVSKGRELADRLNVKLEAVLLGNNVEHCAPELFAYGCDKVFLDEDERLEPFTVMPYAKVIMDMIREHRPNILLFGATLKGRELAPRIASEKRAGLTADCTDLKIDDFHDAKSGKDYYDKLMQIRPAFGGNIIATIVNSWDDPQMVTVREGVMKLGTPDRSRTGEIERVKVALTPAETVVKVIERVRAEKSVDLRAAQGDQTVEEQQHARHAERDQQVGLSQFHEVIERAQFGFRLHGRGRVRCDERNLAMHIGPVPLAGGPSAARCTHMTRDRRLGLSIDMKVMRAGFASQSGINQAIDVAAVAQK